MAVVSRRFAESVGCTGLAEVLSGSGMFRRSSGLALKKAEGSALPALTYLG
jgi:hypothetical protein